jgi:hypothetical protein
MHQEASFCNSIFKPPIYMAELESFEFIAAVSLGTLASASIDTKVFPIPSSNCFLSALLV